jgi:hypothetical protein
MSYEPPAITELGSVAQFTRADWWESGQDGAIFFPAVRGNTPTPTS